MTWVRSARPAWRIYLDGLGGDDSCCCGHGRDPQHPPHYRPGRECAACQCPTYRRHLPWRRWRHYPERTPPR